MTLGDVEDDELIVLETEDVTLVDMLLDPESEAVALADLVRDADGDMLTDRVSEAEPLAESVGETEPLAERVGEDDADGVVEGDAYTGHEMMMGLAADTVTLPACDTVMLHMPAATAVTVVPVTVHPEAAVALYVTARPDVAQHASVFDAGAVIFFGVAGAAGQNISCTTRIMTLNDTGNAAAKR